MEIQELHTLCEAELEELKGLMTQLSERIVLTREDVEEVLENSQMHLFVMRDEGHIVGCASLGIMRAPSGRMATVEDVVVDSAYRGGGHGRKLVEHVIAYARRFAPIDLHLTSKPARVAANALYQRLGFQRKETNCYRMALMPEEM